MELNPPRTSTRGTQKDYLNLKKPHNYVVIFKTPSKTIKKNIKMLQQHWNLTMTKIITQTIHRMKKESYYDLRKIHIKSK